MSRRERRKSPRNEPPRRGATLRREIQQLKQQSDAILLRMDELLRELEGVARRAGAESPKK